MRGGLSVFFSRQVIHHPSSDAMDATCHKTQQLSGFVSLTEGYLVYSSCTEGLYADVLVKLFCWPSGTTLSPRGTSDWPMCCMRSYKTRSTRARGTTRQLASRSLILDLTAQWGVFLFYYDIKSLQIPGTSAVSTTNWVVDTQHWKLRDASGALVLYVFHLQYSYNVHGNCDFYPKTFF